MNKHTVDYSDSIYRNYHRMMIICGQRRINECTHQYNLSKEYTHFDKYCTTTVVIQLLSDYHEFIQTLVDQGITSVKSDVIPDIYINLDTVIVSQLSSNAKHIIQQLVVLCGKIDEARFIQTAFKIMLEKL